MGRRHLVCEICVSLFRTVCVYVRFDSQYICQIYMSYHVYIYMCAQHMRESSMTAHNICHTRLSYMSYSTLIYVRTTYVPVRVCVPVRVHV